MMPKSAKRFSDNIMLRGMRIDHVHDFGSIRSKIIVIWGVRIIRRHLIPASPEAAGRRCDLVAWPHGRRKLAGRPALEPPGCRATPSPIGRAVSPTGCPHD